MTRYCFQVIVLDDDHSVRGSLENLLKAHGFEVRSHASAEDFFEAGVPNGPACLLLDQHLGAVKGTDVHAEMSRRGWELPTVFLTADWDTRTVVNAMRAGADNYLTKPFDPQELLDAIHATCESAFASAVQNDGDSELRQRAALLTTRERTIVSMVVKGMLNKQIASQLQLALVTVKLHRGRAMRKLGAQNPAELAQIALRLGL